MYLCEYVLKTSAGIHESHPEISCLEQNVLNNSEWIHEKSPNNCF